MVSFWPWRGEDSSPASFEKALSALSTKITTTQSQLDKARSRKRRALVLSTLYLGFAYLVSTIVLILVVGRHSWRAPEWTGMAGGPVLIYAVRRLIGAVCDFRIDALSSRLKEQQTSRKKTIQKLKEATKYDSTLQLLEKYGGPENKPKKGRRVADEEVTGKDNNTLQGVPRDRTNMLPPPTANIPRGDALQPSFKSSTPRPASTGPSPSPRQKGSSPLPVMDTTAEFSPNAFGPPESPHYMHHPPAPMVPHESHWYDRILDSLLGEDETAAKNRIVLICAQCRMVNGQAPPGTKQLAEIGKWKCMACGAVNGEMDEGKKIVQQVLDQAGSDRAGADVTDDDAGRESSSSEMVEVEKEDVPGSDAESSATRPKSGQQIKRTKGQKNQ